MQNEQIIQESAKGLIDWFTQTASASEDFIIEQAPLYAQEVVAWTFWSGVIQAAACGIAAAIIVAVSYRLVKPCAKAWKELDEPIAVLTTLWYVMSAIASPIVLGALFMGVAHAIKAYVAPRVVILEHVQQLVN